MLPLRDSAPTYRFPFITVTIIALNVIVFLIELSSNNLDLFFEKYALIGANVTFLSPATLTPFITSQFLHGGWFHLIFNMWYLWIFADNVEDCLGHIRFLIFYLVSGVFAALSQYLLLTSSDIPMLGASGAIAGVLGAYLILFPGHKIDTLIPLGFYYIRRAQVPAQIVLIFWFIGQIFSGAAALASTTSGGVAWWAHIGGFVFGLVATKILIPKPRVVIH